MMNAATGTTMATKAHIIQSCRDILTTRIGTRIERREYGSILPDLVDHPHNASNNLRLRAATVTALARWEPRIAIQQVVVGLDMQGKTTIEMTATRVDEPDTQTQDSYSIALGGLQ